MIFIGAFTSKIGSHDNSFAVYIGDFGQNSVVREMAILAPVLQLTFSFTVYMSLIHKCMLILQAIDIAKKEGLIQENNKKNKGRSKVSVP